MKLDLCFCVVYKVCSVYCTISLPEESSVNKEDFYIKSRLTQSKQFFFFFNYRNSSLVQYKEGLYVVETFLGVFCPFLIQSNQKHTFSIRPFTSDFVYFMSIIIKKLKPSNVYICSDIFKETAFQNSFC